MQTTLPNVKDVVRGGGMRNFRKTNQSIFIHTYFFYEFEFSRIFFCISDSSFSEKPFVSGTKKVEYKCRQWHDTCFHCKVCSTKVIRLD